MERLGNWIGGRHKPAAGVPHDHPLVPVNQYGPPARIYPDRIYKDAAE